jgi:hypothetical protein
VKAYSGFIPGPRNIAALLSMLAAVALPCLRAEETMYLSFDRSCEADRAPGGKVPVETNGVQFVPGLRGQGVLLGNNSRLTYLADKNLRPDSGSVSLWARLERTPEGVGGWPDRAIAPEPPRKSYHLFFGWGALEIASATEKGFVLNQMFAGDWMHLALTWSGADARQNLFLNGRRVYSAPYAAPGQAGEKILLGSETWDRLGLDGVLDEVKIFDTALTEAEVCQIYSEYNPVTPVLVDYAGIAGRENIYRVRFVNTGAREVKKEFTLSVYPKESRNSLYGRKFRVDLAPGRSAWEQFSFTPPEAIDFQMVFSDGIVQRTYETTALPPESTTAAMPLSADGKAATRLVEEIDCAAVDDAGRYRDDGHCRIVESPEGKYRETALRETNAGFAYRFCIRKGATGRPHYLEVEYPDDKSRIFSVSVFQFAYDRVDGSGCLDTIGILTGGNHPLTFRKQSKKLLFWPDRENFMAVFSAFCPRGDSTGPAAYKIRLHELQGPLPRLQVSLPGTLPQREFGIWEEDPTMLAGNWFNRPETYGREVDLAFWRIKAERALQYLRHSGKTCWSMLLFDYYGDNSGSMNYLLPASSLISRAGRLPGWADVFATVFDREGVPFFVELNHRTMRTGDGALDPLLGVDGLAKNLEEAMARGEKAVELFSNRDTIALHAGEPFLDPLCPAVQGAYRKVIAAYAKKFGKYNSFAGINIVSPLDISFQSEEYGYGDYTTGLFEQENKVSIPVQRNDPQRFSKRYKYLKENCWEKWLTWRCEKMRDFYKVLVDTLNKGASGRRLIARCMLGMDNQLAAELARGRAVTTLRDIYRGRGLDLEMLERIDGLVFLPEIAPNLSRVNPEYAQDEQYYNSSPELAALFNGCRRPAVLVQQHANLEIYPDISLTRIKCFWWPVGTYIINNMQLGTYSTPQPDNVYLLENLAWVLGEIDPMFIDHGFWGSPENGAMDLYQKFHQAYLSIPAVKFNKVPGDPAVVRFHDNWFYVVNKAFYPVKVSFGIGGRNKSAVNAVTGDTVNLDGRFSRELQGHEVLVFQCPSPVTISDFSQEIPDAQKERIEKLVGTWKNNLQRCKINFGGKAAAEVIISDAEHFLKNREYTRCESRLQTELLRKMEQELKKHGEQ